MHDPLDLKVHHKNPKTGRTERITPYRLHIEGRVRMFEMPAGSGKFFFENGEEVPAKDCPKLTPYKLPLTEEEMRALHANEIREAHARAEKAEAELAALKNQKPQVQVVSKSDR